MYWGDSPSAAIADSPSLPRREFEAGPAGPPIPVPGPCDPHPRIRRRQLPANPDNRCYFCKHELFTELVPLAKAEGLTVIAYGENASDIGDSALAPRRPRNSRSAPRSKRPG